MRTTIACGLAALTLAAAPRPQDPPELGDPAPAVTFEQVIGAPPGAETSWAALRGKVVVLEFWATWCGACVQHIPATNALLERFADRDDLVYIAVTAEEPDKVERFLAARPRRGWVAIDRDGDAFAAYQPITVPHLVIIDRAGEVAAATWSKHVDEAVLEQALAGVALDLPRKRTAPDDSREAILAMKPPASPEIRVDPHEGPRARALYRQRWMFVAPGFPRSLLLREIYGLPKSQMRLELSDDDPLWYVHAAVPEDRSDELMPLLRATLGERMAFTIEEETSELEVLVLERVPDADPPAASTAAESRSTSRGAQLDATKVPMSRLATHLRQISGDLPCIDETGLTGDYDFEIEAFDRTTLFAALAGYGLQVHKERREMPVSVFVPSDSARRESDK